MTTAASPVSANGTGIERGRLCIICVRTAGKRYGHRKGLLGIEVLNEPISFRVYLFAPSRKQALDQEKQSAAAMCPCVS